MRIYLIGFMGSGKTTLGKATASYFKVPFLDTDEEIVLREQRSIDEIFIDCGELKFRELEKDVLRNTSIHDKMIIATGGGIPCYHHNMEWMVQHGITVYLEWPLELLTENLLKEPFFRPLLPHDINQRIKTIESLFLQRKQVYEQAAITIQMSGDRSKDELALIKCCGYIW